MSYLPSTPQLTVPIKLSVAAVSLTVGIIGAFCFRASVAPQEAIAAAPSAAESIFQHRDSLTASPVSPRLNPTDTVAVAPPPFVTAEVKKYAAELPANLPPQPPAARAIDTVAVDAVAKPATLSPVPDWGGNGAAPLPSSAPKAPPKPTPVVTPPPAPVVTPAPPAAPAVPSPTPVVVPREQKTARNKNTQPAPSDGGLVSISSLPVTTFPAPRVASQYPSASGSTSSPNGLVPLESLGTPRASRANSGGAGDSTIVPIPHLSPYAE